MRIVGGKFRDTALTSPGDKRVRPTAEVVRVALLEMLKPHLPQAHVLDLFAGTGAIGLEAISRGARSGDFVEFNPGSLHALKNNVKALGLQTRCRIFKRDAVGFLERCRPDNYDIVIADPPYEFRIHTRLITAWQTLQISPILALEHATGAELPAPAERRVLGGTSLSIYRI